MLAGLALTASLAGCGVAETTVTAGAASGSAAQQTSDLAGKEDQVRKSIDSALKSDESLRNESERRATE